MNMAKHQEVKVDIRDIECRVCGSNDSNKYGKYKDTQYYICKECQSKFAGTNAYPKMKYPKMFNVMALTYYYNGMSYKNINQTFDDLEGQRFSKSTLWNWITKFSKMGNRYVNQLHPTLSGIWVADETVIDIWGEHYWFWDIIDTQTRFLIASHLSKTRSMKDAKKLFYMAKLRSKTRPKFIITDKMGAYHRAINKVYYSNYRDMKVVHFESEGFEAPINTNLIERFHGTVKQRTKVMRDLKSRDSARIVLDGFITHYNFFMEHSYLDYRTPAEAGGISEGMENWGDLIELGYKAPMENPQVVLEWEQRFAIE
jgi:transposase-like protein